VHARARRDHTGALAEVGHDARCRPAQGRGGQGDDGLAAAQLGRAAVKVRLTADTREELRADGIGAHLAGQIHFQGRVHSHHFVLPANDERVVDVFRWVEREEGIVVNVIVEPLCSQSETGHDLALVSRLACPGDRAGLNQVNDAVGDHFRVDAEILFAFEEAEERLWNSPNAELHRATVFHQSGRAMGCSPPQQEPFEHDQNEKTDGYNYFKCSANRSHCLSGERINDLRRAGR
jgi:hypothetical protein